ncbi:MAG: hypothetical protein P8M25_09015 [Paracoccaceae bacterium]|jgi:hypothetical protein|nr:hypothetical protein [Paracoccaceae bacterium]
MNEDVNKKETSVETSSNENAADIVKIDDSEYNISQMNDKSRSIVLFLRKLDKDIQDTRHELTKNMLARKQAIADLKDGLNSK